MTKYQCPDCYMVYNSYSTGCACGCEKPTTLLITPDINTVRELETEIDNRPLHYPQLINRPKISHSDFCLNHRDICEPTQVMCDICEIAFIVGFTRGRPEIIQPAA